MRDRRPLLLYVDDAQWLDRDGVALLDALLALPDPVPLLLVPAHRRLGADAALLDAIRRRIDDNRRVLGVELAVGRLSSEAARALARRWLGSTDEAACAQLAEQSLGSPFLLNALTRRWGTAQPRALTLHAALLAHVRACSAGAIRVIELLALAARPLPVAQVLAAAQADHDALDELHSARLLVTRGVGDKRALACYHDQIRESALRVLPPARARALQRSCPASSKMRFAAVICLRRSYCCKRGPRRGCGKGMHSDTAASSHTPGLRGTRLTPACSSMLRC